MIWEMVLFRMQRRPSQNRERIHILVSERINLKERLTRLYHSIEKILVSLMKEMRRLTVCQDHESFVVVGWRAASNGSVG